MYVLETFLVRFNQWSSLFSPYKSNNSTNFQKVSMYIHNLLSCTFTWFNNNLQPAIIDIINV